MNYFAQWYLVEFAAGVVAQRGNTTFVPGDFSQSITLPTAVDTAHSFVLLTSRMGSLNQTLDSERTIRGVLSGPTTLTLSRNVAGTVNVDVHWQVVQLSDTTVQSGTLTIGAGSSTSTAAISPVNLSKSLFFSILVQTRPPEDLRKNILSVRLLQTVQPFPFRAVLPTTQSMFLTLLCK